VDVLSPEFVKELEKLQVCNTLHPVAHCCNLHHDNMVKHANFVMLHAKREMCCG